MSDCQAGFKSSGVEEMNSVNWLERINKSIETGEFSKLRDVVKLFKELKSEGKVNLHVFILASRGGVDSYLDHFYAFLKVTKDYGVKAFVHLFSDGQDVPPKQFLNDLSEIEHQIKENNSILASISGRHYAMDRSKNWNKTERVLKAFVKQADTTVFKSATEYVKNQYESVSDENIVPAISEEYATTSGLVERDFLVNLNFRYYGTRQLCHLLVGSGELYEHSSKLTPDNLSLYAMTDDPRMFLSGVFFR